MEEFKKKLKTRQIFIVCGLIIINATFWSTRHFMPLSVLPDHIREFATGYQAGILTVLAGFFIFYSVRYAMIARSPELLKKQYISETDERKLLIMQQSGSLGMNIMMFSLVTASMVAVSIDTAVFFTLLGTCMFVSLIRGALKIYYHNKY